MLDLINESDVNWLDKRLRKDAPTRLRKNKRTKWTEGERQKLKSLFEKLGGDIDKISKELRRGERSVRMNLFFLDLIKENEVDQTF